jgi:hypothetical protein
MEIEQILAFSGLVLATLGILGCLGLFFLLRRIMADFRLALENAERRMLAVEDALGVKAEQEHERLSEQGRRGVQIREDNKEMRRAAMSEGRKMLSGIGPNILTDKAEQEKMKAELVQLAKKYPKVADEVSDGLIREFRLEKYKDLIKGIVGDAIQEDAGSSTGATGGFYGI